jgi:hypothetical protein
VLKLAAVVTAIALGVPIPATALLITIDEQADVSPLPSSGPENVAQGPDGRFYITGDTSTVTTVFGYEFDAGVFNHVGQFTINAGNVRGLDFDPQTGNMFVSSVQSRQIIEYQLPADITAPGAAATRPVGGVVLNLSTTVRPSTGAAVDQLEALSVVYDGNNVRRFLLGEEGDPAPAGQGAPPLGNEFAGGVLLINPTSATTFTAEELFRVDLSAGITAGFDDISGFDVVELVFDGAGNIDKQNTKILAVDDSSSGGMGTSLSSLFLFNLLGDCLETLGGTDCTNPQTFASAFGPEFADPEGVDFSDGKLTLFFESGAKVLRGSVTFESVPEPALAVLLGVALASLSWVRSRAH